MTKIKAAVSQQSQQAAQMNHRNSSVIPVGGVGVGAGEDGGQDDSQQQPRTQRSSSNAGVSAMAPATAVLPHPTSTATNLPEDIAIMEIVLRFLQLLCENHNSDLQNYLRVQPSNKTSYNLVCETLQFLDCICGSTTGGLGLLGLWINENNVHLINQALETLTEYCQGPCHENQYAIINHESNGIDIVIALILNDIQPLSKNNLEMFLALKDNASKLLLAVMESNDDTANAERILYNITPKALIDVIREAYEQGKEMDRQADSIKNRESMRRESATSSPITSIASVAAAVLNRIESISEEVTSRASIASSSSNEISVTATTSGEQQSSQQQLLPSQSSDDNQTTHPSTPQPTSQNEATSPNIETQSSISSAHSQTSMSVRDETESMDTDNSESSEGSAPREVGHNLYILAHKLAKFNKELSVLVKSKDSEALSYYAAHTAQIEVIN